MRTLLVLAVALGGCGASPIGSTQQGATSFGGDPGPGGAGAPAPPAGIPVTVLVESTIASGYVAKTASGSVYVFVTGLNPNGTQLYGATIAGGSDKGSFTLPMPNPPVGFTLALATQASVLDATFVSPPAAQAGDFGAGLGGAAGYGCDTPGGLVANVGASINCPAGTTSATVLVQISNELIPPQGGGCSGGTATVRTTGGGVEPLATTCTP